jgi:hypothetical protein
MLANVIFAVLHRRFPATVVDLHQCVGGGGLAIFGSSSAAAGDLSVPDLQSLPQLDETADALRVERRRPGRVENVSPELIPILRGINAPALHDDLDDMDDLAPARGIVTGLLISGVAWAAVIGSIFFWFR